MFLSCNVYSLYTERWVDISTNRYIGLYIYLYSLIHLEIIIIFKVIKYYTEKCIKPLYYELTIK